jgi:hypothetical protein
MSEKIRDSFIFYRSFYKSAKKLSKEDKAEIFDAICCYALDGEIIEMSIVPEAIFSVIQPNLDANRRKWKNGCKEKKKGSKEESDNKQEISKIEANDKQEISKIEANDKQEISENKADQKQIVSKAEGNVNVDVNVDVECKSEMINTSDLLNSLKENTSEIKKPKKEKKEIVIPDFILKENWEAYLEMRKKKKASPTDFAIEQILKSLAQYEKRKSGAANESLKKSAINNWTDVYEPKEEPKKSGQIHNNFQNQDYNAGTEGFIVG